MTDSESLEVASRHASQDQAEPSMLPLFIPEHENLVSGLEDNGSGAGAQIVLSVEAPEHRFELAVFMWNPWTNIVRVLVYGNPRYPECRSVLQRCSKNRAHYLKAGMLDLAYVSGPIGLIADVEQAC